MFIHSALIEQFTELENVSHLVLALICAVFGFFGLLLFLPVCP
jgi:hypothetical protein